VEQSLPLAGLLANNQLLEIDAAALRFDLSETRQFLEHENLGSLRAIEDGCPQHELHHVLRQAVDISAR
jgi:ATP/maltotriose-dependent transcriptional regulator MalT